MLKYVLRGIWHYRKLNLVVMFAVAISTAVIAGSLIVGDSVRHSLRQMTEQRLGQITHVLHSPRFVRENLAQDIHQNFGESDRVFAPAILLPSSLEAKTGADTIRRAGSVSLVGLDDSGWDLLLTGETSVPGDREVVLGFRTASELNASVGDEVSIWVEIPSSIPRDSLLGERDEVNVEIVATVAAIIPENIGASRFDLNPGQQLPFNAFVSLSTLQERLGLEAVEISRRNPVAKPARINAILSGSATASVLSNQAQVTQELQQYRDALGKAITLSDIGLTLRPIDEKGYLSAESQQMILEDAAADAVLNAAESLGLSAAPTLVYLVNEVFATDRTDPNEQYSMYSIVAGLQTNRPSPLGAAAKSNSAPPELQADEIALSKWLAEDINVDVGDSVTAKWHEVGSHGELPEIEHTFTVKTIFAEDDMFSVDQDLTPYVEGITDVDSFGDWDQPFDMDMDRITDRDDEYWTAHRATPKAFVSLPFAEDLWNSRYGRYTSVRVAASSGKQTAEQLQAMSQRLQFEVQRNLDTAALGLGFRPVLAAGLLASVGANDFTGLFIGFSFFLILSAIILASLMFRLGLQQRISQLGVLNAVGWPEGRSHKLFAMEGLAISVVGACLGAVGGIFFAQFMIYGLTTWWVGAVGTKFLTLNIQPLKLVIAAIAAVMLSMFVIRLALRSFRSIDIRQQLAGNSDGTDSISTRRTLWSRLVNIVGYGSFVAAITVPVLVYLDAVPDGVAFEGITWPMVCFFVGGFACLMAGLFLLRISLNRRSQNKTITSTASGIGRFALANAARNPTRSMLTTALIAFATFVIVAVGAGRRNPLSETPVKDSGNGGFTLVADSAQPVLFDLNTAEGRRQLGLTGSADDLSDETQVYSFGVKPGTDASCVNLFQATVPTLLGASEAFIQQSRFRFSNAKEENPWLRLTARSEPTSVGDRTIPTYPVIGDANTLQYSLKKRVGAKIMVPNDDDPQYALEIVAMLDGSIFQGVLVLSDSNLKRAESEVVGSRYFLIETESLESADIVARQLESGLNDYGFDTESVSGRLAGFLAVQNTYLSTFQMLGGLGLLVGTFGLAAVMVRNVVERRREIALLRAIGFTQWRISRITLFENNVLLLWGIVLGAGSAILAMLPHLRSTGGDLPWQSLVATLVTVMIVGMLACVFAVRAASKISIRENLTSD